MKLDDFEDTKRGNTYTGAELSKAVKRLTAARDGKALLTELERRLLQPRMRLFGTRPISPPIAHLIAIGAFKPTSEQLETLRKFDPGTFGTPPAEAAQPVEATHDEEAEELTLEAAKRLGAKALDARVHDLEKRFPGIWRERSRELTRARTHGGPPPMFDESVTRAATELHQLLLDGAPFGEGAARLMLDEPRPYAANPEDAALDVSEYVETIGFPSAEGAARIAPIIASRARSATGEAARGFRLALVRVIGEAGWNAPAELDDLIRLTDARPHDDRQAVKKALARLPAPRAERIEEREAAHLDDPNLLAFARAGWSAPLRRRAAEAYVAMSVADQRSHGPAADALGTSWAPDLLAAFGGEIAPALEARLRRNLDRALVDAMKALAQKTPTSAKSGPPPPRPPKKRTRD